MGRSTQTTKVYYEMRGPIVPRLTAAEGSQRRIRCQESTPECQSTRTQMKRGWREGKIGCTRKKRRCWLPRRGVRGGRRSILFIPRRFDAAGSALLSPPTQASALFFFASDEGGQRPGRRTCPKPRRGLPRWNETDRTPRSDLDSPTW